MSIKSPGKEPQYIFSSEMVPVQLFKFTNKDRLLTKDEKRHDLISRVLPLKEKYPFLSFYMTAIEKDISDLNLQRLNNQFYSTSQIWNSISVLKNTPGARHLNLLKKEPDMLFSALLLMPFSDLRPRQNFADFLKHVMNTLVSFSWETLSRKELIESSQILGKLFDMKSPHLVKINTGFWSKNFKTFSELLKESQ